MPPAGTSWSRGGGWRRGRSTRPWSRSGLEREIATIVSGFSTALALARGCDLIATVPERHTDEPAGRALHAFPLPVPVPDLTVSLLWHPRLDADPAHRWLRGCVREICAARFQGLPMG